MIGKKKNNRSEISPGVIWPDTGNSVGQNIRDGFGPRTFSTHIATVGYDYDFHRGVDHFFQIGLPIKSPINGTVSRAHYTHFGFEDQRQLEQFTETDVSGTISYSLNNDGTSLRITCLRSGSQSLYTGAGRIEPLREKMQLTGDDWVVELKLSSSIATTGSIGVGVIDTSTNQFAGIEYDGTTYNAVCRAGGGSYPNNVTFVSSSILYMRLEWVELSSTLYWKASENGNSWYVFATGSPTWTNTLLPTFKPFMYWKAQDSNSTPYQIDVDFFNWIDENTIGRFGNWITITDGARRFLCLHFRELYVNTGQYVCAGQEIGTSGRTGFDIRSGRVQYDHVHTEWINNVNYIYTSAESFNPLRPGVLPRNNVSNNYTVNRISKNDPDGMFCHVLEITASREDNDFDMNRILVTGSLGSRLIDFDYRTGLNTDTDIPKNNGVYIVPADFDQDSTQMIMSIYIQTASIGSSWTTGSIRDSAGNLLWYG